MEVCKCVFVLVCVDFLCEFIVYVCMFKQIFECAYAYIYIIFTSFNTLILHSLCTDFMLNT